MAYTPGLNGGRINATIGGNTAGAGSLVSTGTLSLAGGNNITLSQNGNAITVSGMAPTVGVSGNVTFGTLNTISSNEARFFFHNMYVSQSSNTISVSSPSLYALSAGMSGGNTSGDGNSLANKSLYLAGGNNITLSNATGTDALFGAWQTITVSGPNMFRGGVSNIGNSVGTSGTASNQIVFAGGNNVTLSQSTGAGGNTITVSAANQTVQPGIQSIQVSNTTYSTGNVIFSNANGLSFGSSAGGAVTGSYSVPGATVFSNSNNVSFGLNGSTITATATVSQSNQTLGVYASSQTVGQSSSSTYDARSLSLAGRGGISVGWTNGSLQISNTPMTVNGTSNSVTISGGNNITVGNNASTITISAANQTNQTVGLYGISNTTQSSSATVDARSLSFAGAGIASVGATNGSVVISVPAGGGAGDGYNSAQFTNSTADSTMNILWAGNSNGSGNITMGLTGSTVTASAPSGGGAVSGRYFDNMLQQNSVLAITHTSVSTGMYGRVIIQPLTPANERFPYDITASTMRMGFSNSGTSSVSGAFSSSFYIGFYTRVDSTQLSMVNSVSTSYGLAAATNNSASFLGARWLSFHSSQFSAVPAFSEGDRYFFAVLARTSSNSYASHSLAGMHLGASVQRSGYMATAASSHTSFNAWHPFMGVHSLTTHTGLPTTIANSHINKASVYANFVPQIIFDAGLGQVN